ncbi:MAG: hypothetical protein LAT81_11395 [Oceanicaulis sp.]|nr:hypothetical protein [Oceanicaulis sp.]
MSGRRTILPIVKELASTKIPNDQAISIQQLQQELIKRDELIQKVKRESFGYKEKHLNVMQENSQLKETVKNLEESTKKGQAEKKQIEKFCESAAKYKKALREFLNDTATDGMNIDTSYPEKIDFEKGVRKRHVRKSSKEGTTMKVKQEDKEDDPEIKYLIQAYKMLKKFIMQLKILLVKYWALVVFLVMIVLLLLFFRSILNSPQEIQSNQVAEVIVRN